MARRRQRLVLLLAAIALVGAACGGDDGGGDEAASSDTTTAAGAEGRCTEDRVGGEITMATLVQPRALDPIATPGAGTTGGTELAAIYDTLMRYEPESGEYEPQLAESLEPNEDHSEWTLTLREDVTFGNGDPLDADAVVASIERFQGETNTGPYRALAQLITGMEAVDPQTVRFQLDAPWPGFPFLLANSGGMIVNVAAAEAAGESFGTTASGAGAGPFEIERYVPNEEIVLRAKDDYWGGPVCLEQLRFVNLAGDQTTYDAFRSDDVQAAFLREPVTIARAADDGVPGLSNLQNAGNVILINNGVRDSEPVTADERVRRAVSAAIDVEAVDQRASEGAGMPTKAILSEESRFYSDDVEGPVTDQGLARELVEEVKADTGWDGSLRLVCPQAREEAALAIQAQLNAAGFDVELQRVATTGDLVEQVIVRADFELSCWGLNYLDSALWPTMTNTLRSDSPSNYGGYESEAFDQGLVALREASDDEAVTAAIADLQEIWNETVPAVILEALETTIIHEEDLRNVRLTTNSIVLFDDAYLE